MRSCLVLLMLPAAAALAQTPKIADCTVFPANNVWNTPVDRLPVHAQSDAWVTTVGESLPLHFDFGAGQWRGAPVGIPFMTVGGDQQRRAVTFRYADESDGGDYPVPLDAPIEGGPESKGDRHVIVLDRDNCVLYELFHAFPQQDGWTADSGAIFDLKSNTLRPAGWTSADAAGLPILPGLARYEEVSAGEIRHALRFTAPRTQRAWIWPARHYASRNADPELPPMGARFRLKADFDISPFPEQVQVILKALKKYGMILADNGSAWYISGAPDEGWTRDLTSAVPRITGRDFEAVDTSAMRVSPDSAEASQPGAEN